jgi:hypothetical protein
MAGNPKVLRQQWPDSFHVLGDPLRLLTLEEASASLASSGFMLGWLSQKVKEALLEGVSFQYTKHVVDGWKGRADGVVAEYRVATPSDLESITSYTDKATGETRLKRRSMYDSNEKPASGPELSSKEMALGILKAMPREKPMGSKRLAKVTGYDLATVRGLLKKLRAAGKVNLVEGKWVRPPKE